MQATATRGSRRILFRLTLRRRLALTGFLFLLPAVIFFATIWIWPLIRTLQLAFYEYDFLSPPRFVGLGTIKEIVTDNLFWNSFRHTIVFTIASVPSLLVLSLLLALLINALTTGRSIYRTGIYMTSAMSGIVAGITFRLLFNYELGQINWVLTTLGLGKAPWLINSGWAMVSLILLGLWGAMGYDMIVWLAGLQGIDPSLHEAAKIDGAGLMGTFLYVTLPLLRPVFVFLFVSNTIGSLQVFNIVYALTQGGPRQTTETVVYFIWREAFQGLHMGRAAAAASILFFVTLVLSLIQLRSTLRESPY